MLTRRKLIGGLGLLIAAPAVIRVAQLMPIKAFEPYVDGQIFYFTPALANTSRIITATVSGPGIVGVTMDGVSMTMTGPDRWEARLPRQKHEP